MPSFHIVNTKTISFQFTSEQIPQPRLCFRSPVNLGKIDHSFHHIDLSFMLLFWNQDHKGSNQLYNLYYVWNHLFFVVFKKYCKVKVT